MTTQLIEIEKEHQRVNKHITRIFATGIASGCKSQHLLQRDISLTPLDMP
jgi:hypothetical protein